MFVAKIGGAAGVDYGALCTDLAARVARGERWVLVHGGSAATDDLAAQLGHPQRTITAPSGHVSRYTDATTLEIFAMATARLNRALVARLQGLGVNALGLAGIDGALLTAARKTAVRSVENGRVRIVHDDWTGTPTAVNGALLNLLLDAGYLPVIAPLALGAGGAMLNVDADRAAALVAGELQADALLLLSNVAGLLHSFPDPSSLIPTLDAADLDAALVMAGGRMKKKVLAAREAVGLGVARVVIGDGRAGQPLTAALAGAGTQIVAAVAAEALSC